jgi:hypothetical protein
MGDAAVAPQHLLLGLVAEDQSAAVFLEPSFRIKQRRPPLVAQTRRCFQQAKRRRL